jgi:vanillate O-demethylase monooxygenase subunit
MWVANAWYVAGWSHEIDAGRLHARTIIDQPLVLYRTSDGAVVALEDRCPHRFAPLSLGRLEGDALRCMYHGLKFAPDGSCLEIPGQKLIPRSACVRRFPVQMVGSWIWVWMGEADKADAGQVPVTVALDDPGYRLQSGQLDYDAHYLLIDDNLLDLSHLSFAHEKTLGMDMPQWADQRPRVTPLERGLKFERWHTDHPPRGFMKKKLGERADVWTTYDFHFPGIFLQRTGFYPPGTAAKSAGQAPAVEPLFWRLDEQAVTPMGERKSRYFYAVGTRAEDIDPEKLDRLYGVTTQAFHEDKTIIEAQQKVIDRDPSRQMLGTSLDTGPTQFRKMVEAMVAAG